MATATEQDACWKQGGLGLKAWAMPELRRGLEVMCGVWNSPDDKTELLGTFRRGVTLANLPLSLIS